MASVRVPLTCVLIAATHAAVAASSYELALVRGFANPEDVEIVPGIGALLVSEMGFGAPLSGGGLAAVPWSAESGPSDGPQRLWPSDDALVPTRRMGDPSCTQSPDPAAFSAHGLSVADTTSARPLVAVVGHGAREAIEYFEVDRVGPGLRARWVGCVPLPRAAAGNDLVVASDGALLVTNYIPTVHGLRAWIWLQIASLGWSTGDVLSWRPSEGWSAVPQSRGAMPNGILRLDGQTYVAYNGAREIVSLPGKGNPTRRSLPMSGAPDNLSAGPHGTILVVLLDPSSRGAWSVASIDASLGRSETLYVHDGSRLRSATSVVFDGHRYVLGSMEGDAIGVLILTHAAQQGAAADRQGPGSDQPR